MTLPAHSCFTAPAMDEDGIIARRMRFHLMADIECIARASEPSALYDTELGEEVLNLLEGQRGSLSALNAEEEAAAKSLAMQIDSLLVQAHQLERDRVEGRVVHRIEPGDLVSLGWFEKIYPLARSTFALFEKRGWLDDDLWRQT